MNKDLCRVTKACLYHGYHDLDNSPCRPIYPILDLALNLTFRNQVMSIPIQLFQFLKLILGDTGGYDSFIITTVRPTSSKMANSTKKRLVIGSRGSEDDISS